MTENLKHRLLVEEDDEIDLLDLFFALKKRVTTIIAAALIGGILAGGVSYFGLTPQYESTAMVYIISKETTLTSLADLQIGSQLTKDYRVIVTSRPVLNDVIDKLELGYSYKILKNKITIDNPADTRILSIKAKDPDPEMAKKIADTVAETASEYIGDIMEMVPPKMIESGEVAAFPSEPSNRKNAMLGFMAGLLLACGLITVEYLMNDAVKDEEDIDKYLGYTVLASIPLRKNDEEEDKEVMAKNRSAGSKESKNGQSRKKGSKHAAKK